MDKNNANLVISIVAIIISVISVTFTSLAIYYNTLKPFNIETNIYHMINYINE